MRREPGLSAAERADVRADADVTLERRSTLPDTEVVRADKGELAEAVAELNRDPDVVYAEPVVVQSALSADTVLRLAVGPRERRPEDVPPAAAGATTRPAPPTPTWTSRRRGRRPPAPASPSAIVDTGLLTHASRPRQPARVQRGRDRHRRARSRQALQRRRRRRQRLRRRLARLGLRRGVPEHRRLRGRQHRRAPTTTRRTTTATARTSPARSPRSATTTRASPASRPARKIMPLRALGANGRGTNIAIAEAFDYAGKMGLRVVNASLGGPGLDQTQLAAIQAHPNTLYVIAAGNDNVNNDVTPHGPCALPAANILCVGASDENDRRASFSNYGAHERRRVRARHGDPLDLPVALVRVPAGHLDGQPERGRRRGARAVGPARRRARSTSRARSWRPPRRSPTWPARRSPAGASTPTAPSPATLAGAPVNVTPPVITGTPRQGVALSASSGAWNPAGSLVRLRLAAVVRRRRDAGRRSSARPARPTRPAPRTSARGCASPSPPPTRTASRARPRRRSARSPRAPRSTPARPVISGTPRRGQVLTVNSAWSPAGTSYTYQWQRSTDGVTWTDDRRQRVELHAHDGRARGARARDGHGDQRLRAGLGDQRRRSGRSSGIRPSTPTPPSITGTTQRTFTLTAAAGAWDGGGQHATPTSGSATTAAAGRRSRGATASTYKLAKDDEGARVRVLVTASNVDGTRASARATPSVAPVSPVPARQHRRAGHHRHAAAEPDAVRDARDLDRPGQHVRASSGSATSARATWTSPARPARPTR